MTAQGSVVVAAWRVSLAYAGARYGDRRSDVGIDWNG